MRHLLILAASALVACADSPADPSLGELIAKHTQARGGAEAIEAVQAIRFDVRIEEPEFTVDGQYWATRDGSMRIDVRADGERVFTEALDQGRAWQREQGDTAPVKPGSDAGAAALRHGVESPLKLFGLHEMTARGHRLAREGREVVEGVNYFVVGVELDDGYQTRYYLNPDTWLVDRERHRRALHVDQDPQAQWIEVRYDDYRPVAGVLFPFRQVERQLTTGKILATNTTRQVRVNPEYPARFFSEP